MVDNYIYILVTELRHSKVSPAKCLPPYTVQAIRPPVG